MSELLTFVFILTKFQTIFKKFLFEDFPGTLVFVFHHSMNLFYK